MKKLLLLDLDGTILKSSCVLEFANYITDIGVIKTDITRHRWLEDKKNDNYIREFAEHFRNEIKGLKQDYIQDLFLEFFNVYEFEYNHQIIDLINKCKEQNFYCMIISGTIDFMVKEIAKKLNIKGVGSKYTLDDEGKFTGDIDVPMFSQKEKEKIIKSLISNNTVEVIGAGDTTSDIPIALVSDEFYLVNPNMFTINEYSNLDIDYVIV